MNIHLTKVILIKKIFLTIKIIKKYKFREFIYYDLHYLLHENNQRHRKHGYILLKLITIIEFLHIEKIYFRRSKAASLILLRRLNLLCMFPCVRTTPRLINPPPPLH